MAFIRSFSFIHFSGKNNRKGLKGINIRIDLMKKNVIIITDFTDIEY